MTDPNYAHILIVLDRSASMETVKHETIAGVNAFISEQAAQPGRVTLSLVEFNHEVRKPISFLPIGSIPPRDAGNYRPDGFTALWDAVGRAMSEEGELLSRMPESSRPGLVTVVVLTDGEENSSKGWTKAKVQELIDQQTTRYKWVVNFLGASLEVAGQGRDLGIGDAHVAAYSTPDLALAAASRSTTRGRSGTQRGLSPDAVAAEMSYTSDERDAMQSTRPRVTSMSPPDGATIPDPARTRSS